MNTLLEHAAEILILLFLIITFMQSGIDKVMDWTGNLSWLRSHFSETPLQGLVPVLLAIVLIAEMLAGILCAVGLVQLLLYESGKIALLGAIVSCVSLLMLLFGQRLAKDYDGAKTIAVYFIPAVFLVFLLQ
ncbi:MULTISPECIES: hypothetical protein [Robiginitalea]|uniref:DoxX family protein n=1 Tax=Robiginitalea biformata (strain ATCC BAA-864 / DSM 15991 / KCTC 12146 / HTCC2501) TaxID=313596 RepID=A4CI30_ROBBH|nr:MULTISPECIES: hypothetical protein [Robiginitalea]EAR16588.1 hypothetical protein RB2501_06800 [Robiginitalea biformata HTCC2501]MDC6353176.1 DoxX family protein [Robiginitalea sp. PM2]MDC6373657.1 DoxX family protein [Robiginitalea sp. SP8]